MKCAIGIAEELLHLSIRLSTQMREDYLGFILSTSLREGSKLCLNPTLKSGALCGRMGDHPIPVVGRLAGVSKNEGEPKR